MKMKSSFLLMASLGSTILAAHAQRGTLQSGQPAKVAEQTAPPKVWIDSNYHNPFASPSAPVQNPAPVYVYEQKAFGGYSALVTQEQAQTIINRFKEAYPALGKPRLLIYVNRDLVDEQSGMKLIKRQETIESQRNGATPDSSVHSKAENSYRADGKAAPTLADRQTVRDVERLFGRPLRTAGASLVDQRTATQLIADRPLAEFIGSTDTPQARKDREALANLADVVIEILISSKNISVPMISGERTVSVPDIQATAIRLKDSKVLAQASSTDVTGRVPPANLGNYGVNEITEATALALMEDMITE
jgi:hypothetical protein